MRYCWLLLLFVFPLWLHASESWTTLDLQRQIPSEQIIMLKNGEQEFLTLELENMTPFNKGTMILIPDWSQHAASPRAIDFLRTQFIDYGWNTMTMMVPDPLPSLDTESYVAYQTEFQNRLAEVFKQASKKPGNLIIVAQGSSGAIINTMLQEGKITTLQGLVLLSAYVQDVSMNKAMAKALSQHKIPTLDIMQASDNTYVQSTQSLRLQLTRKHMKELYRQRILPRPIEQESEWLFKEIYGWLNYIGY